MHRHVEIGALTLRVFLIGVCLFTFQIIFSVTTGSISLYSDTAHVGADTFALAVVVGAQFLSERFDRKRGVNEDRDYHNVELIAAAFNGLLLWALASVLVLEAISRLSDPPEVSGIILIAGLIGIAVNMLMLIQLWSEREHLTVWSLISHVFFDSFASLGVIIAGFLILATGEKLVDPIVSIVIIALIVIWGLILIVRAWFTFRSQNHAKVT